MSSNRNGPIRVLSQAEIEADLAAVSKELEIQTHFYADLASAAATAEADFKATFARAVVGMSANQSMKLTSAEKQARAEVIATDDFRAWKLAEARRNATKELLLSLRARLDALRSLAANVRYQVGSF
jgi:hypothetical protein